MLWDYMKAKQSLRRSISFILLVLATFFLLWALFSTNRGEAEIASVEQSILEKGALLTITPDLIEQLNLTVDWNLQKYIAVTARKYKVGFTSVVVMDAFSGDILALYGNDDAGENCALSLDTYLGASTFKLVTAAAALEECDISPTSVFTYNGKSNTLYKNQISQITNRWSRKITLARAFALSNNVVFAKIGLHHLGEGPLLLTAMKLGFWQPPLREVLCTPSTLSVPDNEYNLAELSSGFNHSTRISPIHAAQMITAVVNDGTMVTPRIIRSDTTDKYQVFSKETAGQLQSMMARTIRSGTLSKAFRGYGYDKVLKRLSMGAKSGTIDGTDPEGRYTWFVGYAQDEKIGRAITIACLVVRQDYFWIEADRYARKVIRHCFSKPFTVATTR